MRAMHRTLTACVVAMALAGCAVQSPPVAELEAERSPAQLEAAHLTDVVQLTFSRDYDRAGEAYFSKDMRWVVFQAVPKGERNYQMYLARIAYVRGHPAGLLVTTRITPPGSRNTCGWFSDDGKTLIFASTAGEDDPDEPAPGYQREGRNYRWAFSPGMEIYRVPDWERQVAMSVGGYVNLARPEYRITDNDYYDAECVLSPDGKWMVFCSDRPSEIDPAFETATPATQPAARPRQLWIMNMATLEVAPLTATPGYNGGPFFSTDGRRMVYRSDRVGNDLLQVYVADVVRDRRGSITGLRNEQAITSDANVNWGPFFSPDGRWVYYASSKVSHANYEIFARRTAADRPRPAEGAGERGETRITFAAGPDVLPVISPDGRLMMWSSRRGDDPTTQVYVARLTPPKAR